RTASCAAREARNAASRLWAVHDTADRKRREVVIERLQRAEALKDRMERREADLTEIAEVRSAAVASVADVYGPARPAREEFHYRGIRPETLPHARGKHEPEPAAAGGAAARHAEPERARERE